MPAMVNEGKRSWYENPGSGIRERSRGMGKRVAPRRGLVPVSSVDGSNGTRGPPGRSRRTPRSERFLMGDGSTQPTCGVEGLIAWPPRTTAPGPRRGATEAVVPDGVRVPTRVPMFHQVVCRIACPKVTPSAQVFLPMRLNGTPPLAVGRGAVGQRDRSRARGRQRGAGLGADTGGALLWWHTASCRHVVPFSIADVTRAPEDRHVVVDDGGSELRCTRRPGRLTSPRRRDHGPTGRAGRPGSCGL